MRGGVCVQCTFTCIMYTYMYIRLYMYMYIVHVYVHVCVLVMHTAVSECVFLHVIHVTCMEHESCINALPLYWPSLLFEGKQVAAIHCRYSPL